LGCGLSLLAAKAVSNSPVPARRTGEARGSAVRRTGCYAPAPFHRRISISHPSPPGGMAGKAQQRDHCSRSNVAAASSTKMWQARKIFVGIAVGISSPFAVTFYVKSMRYGHHASPARAPIRFHRYPAGAVARAPRTAVPRRDGRAAVDFAHSPGASSSRRLILRMEDAVPLARAQTLR
jgi:hypothetical protein